MNQTTLGRYRIVGELGRGAMGIVYRAYDPLIEREVAVKTLHVDLPPEAATEVRDRFLREAKSAGRLNHPNIVTIFDVGEHDGVAYMAMELLEGRSLQQMLRASGRLPFSTAADLAAQIADALERAQQLSIVHRDIKPANVVVSTTGLAKLTDFGVAYVPSSTMTQTGAMIGSPRYMSPEQVLGLPVDPRADIFSLGVVLYEMLTGRTPFVRDGDTTIFPLINRIASEPHAPVSSLDPSIPAGIDAILSKALAKKPEGRYQRASDMARELRTLGSSGQPGSAAGAAIDDAATVVRSGTPVDPSQYQTTVILPAAARTTPGMTSSVVSGLLKDLDAFSQNFEAEQAARLQAENEERERKAEELRRWSEAEARKRADFDRQQRAAAAPPGARSDVAPAPGAGLDSGATTNLRRGALDLLRNKAATRRPEDEAAARKAESTAKLDQCMRAGLKYLAEVASELNRVHPVTECPYLHMLVGRLPAVRLSGAFVDLRTRRIGDADLGERLFFRFRVQPVPPASVVLLGADIARLEEQLKAKNVAFESKIDAMGDFGKAKRATFTISGSLPCEANILADYDKSGVEIELMDIRRPGRVRCRIEIDALDEAVDELARYILGVDKDFEKRLDRR